MEYNLNIVDGQVQENIINGSYNVSANVKGYDNSTITPSSVNITEGVAEYSFTVSSSGSLTLHVTEEGLENGAPVVGATFYRTDKNGQVYGSVITTDTNGDAVFNNLPFFEDGSVNVYYKQTSSDNRHTFNDSVVTINLTQEETTRQIANVLALERTIKLTDSNYTNLPIESAVLSIN